MSDVVDAVLVLLAEDADRIATSAAGDFQPLVVAAGIDVELIHA